jgi:hypothetical protein
MHGSIPIRGFEQEFKEDHRQFKEETADESVKQSP